MKLLVDFGDIVEYVPDAEIWGLYNENRELLGKDHVRGEQLPIDGYHLVVQMVSSGYRKLTRYVDSI